MDYAHVLGVFVEVHRYNRFVCLGTLLLGQEKAIITYFWLLPSSNCILISAY
jgi:hypothetical protein